MKCEVTALFADCLKIRVLDQPTVPFIKRGQTLKLYFPGRFLSQIEVGEIAELKITQTGDTKKLVLKTKRVEGICNWAVQTEEEPDIAVVDNYATNFDETKGGTTL